MVSYEWGVELRDIENQDDDFDTDCYDSSDFASAYKAHIGIPGTKLVLRRIVGNEDDGITEWTWAYFESGKLDEWCRDSRGCAIHKTPAKFIKQSQSGRQS